MALNFVRVSFLSSFQSIGKRGLQSRYISTAFTNKDPLKDKLRESFPLIRDDISKFRKEHGETVIGEITINQVYGGMRGINACFHEGSQVDPAEGIRYRGYTIFELQKLLPKANDGLEPLPEGVFWLLLTGEIPTKEQVDWLSSEWYRRSQLPFYLTNVINAFPYDLHPMAQLSAAVAVLSRKSQFAKAYNEKSYTRNNLWEFMYEDCMDLIAKIPGIAAKIYRNCFYDGNVSTPISNKDWSYNYAYMLNLHLNKNFVDYLRLYLFSHADHEGANVSAHTCALVGSGLSDMYLSMSACINGLAGPLHGRANQEVMQWLHDFLVHFKGYDVTNEQIKEYCAKQIADGKVIPGFGHAALRITDPRYSIQRDFAVKHIPEAKIVKLLRQLFDVVPPLLQSHPKIKNPFPNVDGHSGSLFDYFGMVEQEYYTVPFAVARCIGVSAAMITSRGLWLPIERPKSLTTKSLKEIVQKKLDKTE